MVGFPACISDYKYYKLNQNLVINTAKWISLLIFFWMFRY